MKKVIAQFFLIFLVTILLGNTSVNAAISNKGQATAAVSSIQQTIAKTKNSLLTSSSNSQVEISTQTQKNQSILNNLENDYKIKKATADSRTIAAINSINQYSYFVVQVNNLSRCNGNCAAGTVINLPFLPNDDFTQQGIDQNVKAGAMIPQNKVAYDSAREEYSKSLENALQIYSQYLADKKAAEGQGNLALFGIMTKYQNLENNLKEQLDFQNKVLIAAKRALQSGTPYETNFKVAFEFQYNVDTSYLVANSHFSTINSFLSARAVVSAADDYSEGFSISKNYNLRKALNFNKKLQGAYTNDPEFSKQLLSALKFYRSSK